MRLRVEGAERLLSGPDGDGGIQSVSGNEVLMRRARDLAPGPLDPARFDYLGPEPLIESDDPAIRAEAQKIVAGIADPRERAQLLLRHVYGLIDKRPTVSLPSAAEVLRTRVGDCNEHTVLYVALARAAGVPARVAVGLVYLAGAFHYHAWAEVYLEGPRGRGVWWPADPTFGQFPADPSHLRLARGGLDRQAAILTAIGRIRITIVDIEMRPVDQETVLVGRARKRDSGPIDIPLPSRGSGRLTCWGDPD
jgi:transglutaminase-like putative cysteine protease